MATPKPPTPQGISRLLAKAGFQKSERKGRYSYCSGYRVEQGHAPLGARVRYYSPIPGGGAERKDFLAKYSKTITGAGWTVEAEEYELVVTAGKEG